MTSLSLSDFHNNTHLQFEGQCNGLFKNGATHKSIMIKKKTLVQGLRKLAKQSWDQHLYLFPCFALFVDYPE